MSQNIWALRPGTQTYREVYASLAAGGNGTNNGPNELYTDLSMTVTIPPSGNETLCWFDCRLLPAVAVRVSIFGNGKIRSLWCTLLQS